MRYIAGMSNVWLSSKIEKVIWRIVKMEAIQMNKYLDSDIINIPIHKKL